MDKSVDIKALRDRLQWTQDDLAKFLGLDRSSVSRMENGQRPKGPAAKLLQRLVEEKAA